ncbi:S-layer homology domain-containing protein [uncultured Fenollaria sp.]|uniref:S-layer homology domain-containing protein n=1 Tax=uncultured Fenollaria sp. TaxID=1686315 RepID=UPI0025F6AD9F|nr:S-layer homology domain-containing protein [uncultured Fenollaria sp.]
MNKLKRIISLVFIIAFALSQFEYIKAESVEADMTDAKNVETVVASEEVEKEEAKAETVAGCQTHEDAIKELEEALKNKIESVNTKNDDYMLRLNKVANVEENQDPNKYVAHYQLSFTILDKDKTFEEIDMMSLAGAISDLLIDKKVDKMRINEEKDIDLVNTLTGTPEADYKHAISEMIIEGIKKSLKLNDETKLGDMHTKESGIRISKAACEDKEAFIWLRIPFRNAIVNEIKDKIEAQDITVNKNAEVNWKDGVKIKDSVANKQGYQGHIDHATVTDESARDTKTVGEKSGKIKLKFTDDTELTLENQKLIVKEDKKAEENNNTKPSDKEKDNTQDNNKKPDTKEKEAMPERKDKENNRNHRNDRYDRYNKDKKNESNEKNTKLSKNDKVDKKETKREAKQDYGILAPAQALRLVQHRDLPDGEKGEAIRELIARGVLSGVSDTEFKGKLAINRAMLAQVLMTISKDKSVGLIDYEDIKGDEWYADAMTWALTYGIYKGYPDKTVKATQKITRQEFASVIYNFIKEHKINMPKVKNFNYKDQDKIASWALDQVKYMDELGLVNGESQDNYNATSTYTREDLALSIYKIIRFIESK